MANDNGNTQLVAHVSNGVKRAQQCPRASNRAHDNTAKATMGQLPLIPTVSFHL